jgi:hypothetical protein
VICVFGFGKTPGNRGFLQFTMNMDRLDSSNHRDLPGSVPISTSQETGNVISLQPAAARTVPHQSLWRVYMSQVKSVISFFLVEGVGSCGKGAHRSLFYRETLTRVLGVVTLLSAMADERMTALSGDSWEINWTYLVMFHSQYLKDLSGCDMHLEQQLIQLATCDESNVHRLGRVLAARMFDRELYNQAMQRFSRTPPSVPANPRATPTPPLPRAPPAGGGGASGRAERCALCGSTEHVYSNPFYAGGAWEHTADQPATIPCLCGQLHARLGPLKSNCAPPARRQ